MTTETKPRVGAGEADITTGLRTYEVGSSAERLQKVLEGVADQIISYSLEIQSGDKLLIQMGPDAWQLTSMVMDRARKIGAEVRLRQVDSKNVQPAVKTIIENVSQVIEGKPGSGLTQSLNKNGEAENRTSDLIQQKQTLERELARVEKIKNTFLIPKVKQQLEDINSALKLEAEELIQGGVLNDEMDDVLWADKVLVVRQDLVDTSKLAAEKIYSKHQGIITDERVSKPWALVYYPTQAEADAAKMSLEDYTFMYYEACNRDWEAVDKAQKELRDLLMQAESFTMTAGAPENMQDKDRWSASVTMNIEGMIAASSVAKKNLPGSEVFLAPNRYTLEGQYAIPYPVRFGKRILPNIGFEFQKGKVISFWMDGATEEDEAYVHEVLASPGANEVGELGIGTNPSIMEAFLNTLLVEKAGGSIHLALGAAYPDKKYLGADISVDNNVRSDFHIDLTRMMTPEYGGGSVVLTMKETDAEGKKKQVILQENGKFVDPRFGIFNREEKRAA